MDKPVPRWIEGDSAQAGQLLQGEQFDFIWCSPPYFNLEDYGGGAADGSGMNEFERFCIWYEALFASVCAMLKPNRFIGLKLGEVRGADGGFVSFVPFNADLFIRLGFSFVNEAILVTPVGSMPVRAGRQFRSGRKLTKGHQNVLLFYKGDPRQIKDHYPAECSGVDLSGEIPEMRPPDRDEADE
jgi:DNA modification methylase